MSAHDENDDFVQQLPKPLQNEYLKEKSDKIKEIRKTFSAEYKRHYLAFEGEIETDQSHTDILNSCIFPFTRDDAMPSRLDYEYIRSSPLSETGEKHVDFLITSQTKRIVIFGEAKGSISDTKTVITQYKKRMEIINKHMDIVNRYVPNPAKIEYVLGVYSWDSEEMMKAISRSNANIILWEIDVTGDIPQLSLVTPPGDHALKSRMTHSDNDLNNALDKLQTTINFKAFFNEGHPVTKLSMFTTLGKHSDEFTYSTLKDLVRRELDNTSEADIERTTSRILKLGIDIDFITRKAEDNYKIHTKYRQSRSRYEELIEKWIKYRINQKESESIDRAVSEIQARFNDKKREQPSMEDYQ